MYMHGQLSSASQQLNVMLRCRLREARVEIERRTASGQPLPVVLPFGAADICGDFCVPCQSTSACT